MAGSRRQLDRVHCCLRLELKRTQPTLVAAQPLPSRCILTSASPKFPLLQLHAEALFPSYRGAPLHRLLEACDACSAPGNVKDHLAGRSSECYVCAVHRKVRLVRISAHLLAKSE